jgi:hypothetical protein
VVLGSLLSSSAGDLGLGLLFSSSETSAELSRERSLDEMEDVLCFRGLLLLPPLPPRLELLLLLRYLDKRRESRGESNGDLLRLSSRLPRPRTRRPPPGEPLRLRLSLWCPLRGGLRERDGDRLSDPDDESDLPRLRLIGERLREEE